MVDPGPARGWRDRSLAQLTLTRYREFFREPEALFWVFVFPILLAAGLGVAFRNRPADVVKVAVAAGAPGADTLAQALRAEPGLAVQLLADTAAARALRVGEVALVAAPEAGAVRYRYDPTRPDGRAARLLADQAVQRAAGRRDPVSISDETVQEAGARYIDFVLPGLLGMNLMGSGIWGLGFTVVEARRKKLLKRLVATPMSRAEYLLSFLLSRLTMLVAEVALLLGFGALAFGVPVRGPWPVLLAVCLLASLAFSGLGLLIAARPRTIEGVSGLMNLVMLPMWIFSGVFFSATNFPPTFQPFIQALPLTAVIDALRLTMLQGAGWGPVLPELGIIAAWLVLGYGVALKIFRWK